MVFRHRDRAVLPAGAAESDGDMRFALFTVGGEQQQAQIEHFAGEVSVALIACHMGGDGRIPTVAAAQFGHPIGVS